MKVAVFYVLTPITSQLIHDRVPSDQTNDYDYVFPCNQPSGLDACVRMEFVEADSLEAALHAARPRDGEAVMNTHEVAE